MQNVMLNKLSSLLKNSLVYCSKQKNHGIKEMLVISRNKYQELVFILH